MVRPLLLTLGVGIFGGLMVGCGGGKGPGAGASSTGGRSVSTSQAIAYAHAVNLRHSDVPSLVPDRYDSKANFLESCEKPASSGEVVSIPSQGFHQSVEHRSGGTTILSLYPEESVRSAVYVMKSHGLAVEDLAVSFGSQGRACLGRAFSNGTTAGSGLLGGGITRSESRHEEATLTQIRVGAFRVHLRGVQVEGMRATARLAAAPAGTSGRSPYFEDVLGFVSGPSQVFLRVTSSPYDPAATDRRLLSLLYHRAGQASL